jgi:hypothetical protein
VGCGPPPPVVVAPKRRPRSVSTDLERGQDYFTSLLRSAHLSSPPTRTTFSRTCCMSSCKRLTYAWTPYALAVFRALAARHGLEDLDLFTVVADNEMTDKADAIVAGVGAFKAGVMRLYGIVVILDGWVRVGCARLSRVHSLHPFCGPGSGVCHHLRGHLFIRRLHYTYFITIINPFRCEFGAI